MQRRRFLQLLPLPLAGLALAGCGGLGSADGVDRGRLSAELKMLHWADYISPAVLKQFEAEYGVKVRITLVSSNEEIETYVREAVALQDLLVASDYMISRMRQHGLLMKLDASGLGNLANVAVENRTLYFDPGNDVSVPYLWGSTGLLYDPLEYIATGSNALTHWRQVLRPSAAFGAKLGMLDDMRESMALALRDLGASGNSADPGQIAAAGVALAAQRAQGVTFDTVESQVARLLAGELIATVAYTGDAVAARRAAPRLRYIIPIGVSTLWQDNLAIPVSAQSSYTARVFINFLLRPDVAAANANQVGGASPNAAARRLGLIAPELAGDVNVYPDFGKRAGAFEWLRELPDRVGVLYQLAYDRALKQ